MSGLSLLAVICAAVAAWTLHPAVALSVTSADLHVSALAIVVAWIEVAVIEVAVIEIGSQATTQRRLISRGSAHGAALIFATVLAATGTDWAAAQSSPGAAGVVSLVAFLGCSAPEPEAAERSEEPEPQVRSRGESDRAGQDGGPAATTDVGPGD
jgi:hypothetical protein